MKQSGWTNISAAGLGTANYKGSQGWYGGLQFSFIERSETETVDGVQVITEVTE